MRRASTPRLNTLNSSNSPSLKASRASTAVRNAVASWSSGSLISVMRTMQFQDGPFADGGIVGRYQSLPIYATTSNRWTALNEM